MTLNIPISDRKRIVVVGGGFAGLTLVRKLEKSDYQIVLLDRNNFHLFQPLLYQVATAALPAQDIIFPYRKLFHRRPNIFFRMTEVTGVDSVRKIVITNSGELSYDCLVLANGSQTNFFGMEDIRKNAFEMKKVTDSLAIRNRFLRNIERTIAGRTKSEREELLTVVIVGGGPSGVELAGAFGEIRKYIVPEDYPEVHGGEIRIVLVEAGDKLIGTMSEKTSEGTLSTLNKMGVEVILGTAVSGYKDGRALLKDGRAIPTRNLIWTSGVKAVVPSGLEKATISKPGRIETDGQFKVKGYCHIYAIGDVSFQKSEEFPGGYPQLAREAMMQASHLAKYFRNFSKGKETPLYKHKEYPVMATIGRNHAYAEWKGMHVAGFAGWVLWAGVHLVSILGVRNKVNIFFGWFRNYITFDHPDRYIIGSDKPDQAREGKDENPVSNNVASGPDKN